ncbi:hypothetical protein V2G26_005417 [Clonostachys chloroleuca]
MSAFVLKGDMLLHTQAVRVALQKPVREDQPGTIAYRSVTLHCNAGLDHQDDLGDSKQTHEGTLVTAQSVGWQLDGGGSGLGNIDGTWTMGQVSA